MPGKRRDFNTLDMYDRTPSLANKDFVRVTEVTVDKENAKAENASYLETRI